MQFWFWESQIEHRFSFYLADLFVCVCWCVCTVGSVFKGVRKSNVRVTGCASSRRSLPNREPFGFFSEGPGCRTWLVTKAITRSVTNPLINQ